MIPIAKKSTSKECAAPLITSGAIYPGVPLVSPLLLSLLFFAIPKSVILTYPSSSKTKFSGLISLCIIFFECIYSNEVIILQIKNRVCSSENLICLVR